ncbi:MAG: hypothetical protein WCG75_04380 [Armatimonadota bacterium]
MRKKVFFAPRAVRIAIGIFSGTVFAGGSLAIFYATNNTLKDLRNRESNERLVKNAGVFSSENDYYNEKSALSYQKEAYQTRVINAAVKEGILGQKTISSESIQRFLADLEKPENHIGEIKSVADRDRYSVELNQLVNSLLVNSSDLNNGDPKEFALKVATFKVSAKIGNCLDGQGTFVGVLSRAKSDREILEYLQKFREQIGVDAELKAQLVASCIDTLDKPFDLSFMFKFEHLRIQTMIKFLNGEARIERHSKIFERPKPLNINEKLQLAIPGVHLAWMSRVDEIFTNSIGRLKDADDYQKLDSFVGVGPRIQQNTVNAGVIGQTANKVYFDKSNTNYLAHYGFDLAELGNEFSRIWAYLTLVRLPVKTPGPTMTHGPRSNPV